MLNKVLIASDLPTNKTDLVKTHLNEIYSKVHIRKFLIPFLFNIVWKKEDALPPLLFNFALP
jgi:hypothetical protein